MHPIRKKLLSISFPVIGKTGKGEGFTFVEYPELVEKIFPLLREEGLYIHQECSTFTREDGKIEFSVKTIIYDSVIDLELELGSYSSFVFPMQGLNTMQSTAASISFFKRIALINELGLVVKDLDGQVDVVESEKGKLGRLAKNKPEAALVEKAYMPTNKAALVDERNGKSTGEGELKSACLTSKSEEIFPTPDNFIMPEPKEKTKAATKSDLKPLNFATKDLVITARNFEEGNIDMEHITNNFSVTDANIKKLLERKQKYVEQQEAKERDSKSETIVDDKNVAE